jgi:hypothetical protein
MCIMSGAPAAARLPDINAESYPFDLVQRLLDQAAYLNLYCLPRRVGGCGLRMPKNPQTVLGFDVVGTLRSFDIEVRLGERGAGPTASNRLGDEIGQLRERWMIVPHDFRALPDLEPPPTAFDASRSQRFVILDSVFSMVGGEEGFRCFGTGTTFPIPGGNGRVLAAAVGTLIDGFGKLAGREGTCTYVGTLDAESGFRGNVLCRIPDHGDVLRTDRRLPRADGEPLPEDEGTYLVLYGRKPEGQRESEYLLRPDGGMRGLRVAQEIHLIALQTASTRHGVRSVAQIEERAGSMTSEIAFDLLAPGPPGSAAAPIPFSAYNEFHFVDRHGVAVGSIDGDGSEGRTFTLAVRGAPGQRGLRFGGFGPVTKGRGCFADARGLMTDNSVVGLAPHATSTLYVLRLDDPEGRFRSGRSVEAPVARRPTSQSKDPFEPLLEELEAHRPQYLAWRQGFRRCSRSIAEAVAGALNARLQVGDFPGLRVDPQGLQAILEAEVGSFDEPAFERYRGTASGTFRTYDLDSNEEVVPPAVLYSYWSPGSVSRGARRFKRITGSFSRYVRPEEIVDPAVGDVDLLVNSHAPEVGVTSWVSIFQHRRQERTSFAYRLPAPHEVLWFVKDVSLDGEPVEDDVFMASHEWKGIRDGQTCYYMVGIFFQIDFDTCRAAVTGDTFWRALYVEEPEGAIEPPGEGKRE